MEYVVCIYNNDYEVSLEKGKIHQVLERLEKLDKIKIIDETNEDYIYNSNWFMPIKLPKKIKKALNV